MVAIVYFGSRNIKITIGTAISMFAIGLMGLWNDTMVTLAMVTVCTLIAIVIGIPIGILMARSDRVQSFVNPVLDVMQTMPSFVYLIPVVMIFGIGKVPGLIAVVIYAVPPMIRLTNLGIRLVDKEVLEAADAFGSSGWQKLKNVQMPLALPTIMAGINQTIMMSLAMVVVASMVGVGGLGKNVLQAINNQFFTVGFLNGFALVAIDLADVHPRVLKGVPFTTWLRVQRIVEGSDTACLLVGPEPLARGAGGLTVLCAGRTTWSASTHTRRLTGLDTRVRVISPRRRVDGETRVEAVTSVQ